MDWATVLNVISGLAGIGAFVGLVYCLYIYSYLRTQRTISIRDVTIGNGAVEIKSEHFMEMIKGITDPTQQVEAIKAAMAVPTEVALKLIDAAQNKDTLSLHQGEARRRLRMFLTLSMVSLTIFVLAFFVPKALAVQPPHPIAPTYPGIEVEKRTAELDLRNWRPVPPTQLGQPISPAVWNNYFEVRKAADNATTFTHRYSTSGLTPQFCSDTNKNVKAKIIDDALVGRPNLFKYDVSVDIGDKPCNFAFPIHLRAVFWNEHLSATDGSDCISVPQPTKDVVFRILFPKDKPPRNLRFTSYPRTNRAAEETLHPQPNDLMGSGQDTVVWHIKNPELNYVYKAYWEW